MLFVMQLRCQWVLLGCWFSTTWGYCQAQLYHWSLSLRHLFTPFKELMSVFSVYMRQLDVTLVPAGLKTDKKMEDQFALDVVNLLVASFPQWVSISLSLPSFLFNFDPPLSFLLPPSLSSLLSFHSPLTPFHSLLWITTTLHAYFTHCFSSNHSLSGMFQMSPFLSLHSWQWSRFFQERGPYSC